MITLDTFVHLIFSPTTLSINPFHLQAVNETGNINREDIFQTKIHDQVVLLNPKSGDI